MALLHLYFVLCPNRLETGIQNEMIGGNSDFFRYSFVLSGEVVSAKVIMDRETGRSKGYGFVEMAEDEAGNKAIEALNDAEVDGKTLSVSVARPKTEGPRRSYNNNGGGGYHGGNRGGGYGNRDNNYGGGNRDNNYGGGRNRY